MVIKHKINTSLEDAYYNILWRLDSVGANYETENHIVPKWDPTARDEYGNQYPKPDPDTVGTGTAWIKILFKDRKQVLVYFCCHLVECKTCTYDRFITVYNYTDDIGDTNLQSMLPWLALKYYGDISSDDSDRTVYFKAKSYTDNALEFYAPEYTVTGTEPCDYVDNAGNPCKNGTITTKVAIPKGNDNTYIPAPTIEIKTVCPKCNGSGKLDTVTELVKGGWLMLYEFYINVDNGYYKEYQKVTDFNIELYKDPKTGRPLNSLEAVYELIEKTKAENESKSINEQTDLSDRIFAIPIFTKNVERDIDTDEPTTRWIISGYRFYQTNYVDKDGKLIPLKAYAYWIPYKAPQKNIPDDYNRLGVSDYQLSLYSESGSSQIQVEPDSYTTGIMYQLGGIKNFLKHCGEVETNAATLHTPLVETYTDISDTDKIWNFICRKDKNLPIFPFDNNTLYISETSKPFEVDLYKNNNLTFKNILAQKTASNHSPLDAAVIKPEDPVPAVEPTGNEDKIPVYPIDYFYGIGHITNIELNKYLQLSNASNNSTYEFRNGYGDTIPRAGDFNSTPGLIINNYTKILNLCFNFHITIPEDKINKHASPYDTHLSIFTLRIAYGDIDDDGNTFTSEHQLLSKQIQMDVRDIYKSIYIDDDGNISYVWPTSINIIDYVLIDRGVVTGDVELDIPFKNKRIYFSISNSDRPELNPYDVSAIDITVEVTALSNIQRVSFKTDNLVNTNINLLPKIEYNYNNYPEGVFNYYQNKFDTSIENYIFYKYHNELMDREPTDNGLTLIPDTIESQKKYKGFLNLMYQRKLRSIYAKQDSRDDYFTCPICHGDTNIKCDFCNGKRKISMYDYNKNPNYNPNDASKGPEILVRYTCPDINNIDHEQGISCANRCRICAGTKSMVRYYYYNSLEFKNLTEYNGKNPVDIESLSDLDTLNIKNRILTSKVKEKGSTLEEPYLNYLIRKYYNVPVQGTELDFDKYYEYYNMAINNTVFYILNGNFTSYYYYVGNGHIKVDYGYNYIYSTKTVDRKTWDRDKGTFIDNTVLYRVISDPTDVDNMIGFYVITETDVKTKDTNFTNARVQRIYFDKSWVYSNLLNDMTFNKFNAFIENKHNVVGKHQDLERTDVYAEKLPSYAHIHDEENDQLVDTRCTTCNGTGIDPEDETKPCPLCGGSGDYPDNLQPETLYFEKAVYSYSSSEYINTNNISFEVDDQVSVDDLDVHEE